MPVVDFNIVSEELEDAEHLTVMPALVRSSVVHGADNTPAVLILTDKTLFYGGSAADGGWFRRVPLKSVVSACKAGGLIWECVELRHMDVEGEMRVYICPFTGSLGSPRRDLESMELLLSALNQR